jgi:hypothetical protein
LGAGAAAVVAVMEEAEDLEAAVVVVAVMEAVED